jgi:co-chaperonin GroES (HSP10)
MLIPLGKRIIVRPIEVKHGTLVVTGLKPTQFLILAIGDEVTKVKVGDTIYLDKHIGAKIEHEKEEFMVIEENSILAKLD